jgi:hypothetical protein
MDRNHARVTDEKEEK